MFKKRKEKLAFLNHERTISKEHGFELNITDFGPWYKERIESDFFNAVQINDMLSSINQKGYLDEKIGSYLSSIFNSGNNIYVKTVYSSDVDSIMEEGIRCLGTSTSGFGLSPKKVSDVNLKNTITMVDGMFDLVVTLKNAYGISQGMNPINGTIILSIPKEISINEILYFSDRSNCYCIKPKYIDCFIEVDENKVVSAPIFNDDFYLSSQNENIRSPKPHTH